MSAIQQLEEQRTSKRWLECANLMGAVNQLSESFAKYNHIPKVQFVFTKISGIRESLRSEVKEEFSKYTTC